MPERRIVTIDGNEAAAYVAHKTNEVIAIYPITPSSVMGELSDVHTRGRMVSLLTTFLFLGQFLPPIIFNPVFSAFSFAGVFLASGLACAFLTVLFVINSKRKMTYRSLLL